MSQLKHSPRTSAITLDNKFKNNSDVKDKMNVDTTIQDILPVRNVSTENNIKSSTSEKRENIYKNAGTSSSFVSEKVRIYEKTSKAKITTSPSPRKKNLGEMFDRQDIHARKLKLKAAERAHQSNLNKVNVELEVDKRLMYKKQEFYKELAAAKREKQEEVAKAKAEIKKVKEIMSDLKHQQRKEIESINQEKKELKNKYEVDYSKLEKLREETILQHRMQLNEIKEEWRIDKIDFVNQSKTKYRNMKLSSIINLLHCKFKYVTVARSFNLWCNHNYYEKQMHALSQQSKQVLKQFTERLKTKEIDTQQFHDKQKKYVCQMIINKWVNKNILFGFNKWKKYSTMIVISKYEKELNQSKLQMEEKERMFNEKIKTANLNIQKHQV